MIKSNELRIGNWLLHDGMHNRVAALAADDIVIDCFPAYGAKASAFEPIPLTPELLEKAGLEKLSSGEYSIRIDEYIWLHIEEDGRYGFWSDSIENETNFTVMSQDNRVTFLHQLQNLYFALTGEELEVNM